MVLESSSISLFAFRAFAPVKNDTAAPIAAMADAINTKGALSALMTAMTEAIVPSTVDSIPNHLTSS